MAELKTEPPAKGTKAVSPVAVSRGSMSIRASPQQRIMARSTVELDFKSIKAN
jgi:hypothetical protein